MTKFFLAYRAEATGRRINYHNAVVVPTRAMSSNEEDAAALTPGHFLIGAPLPSPAEPFNETDELRSLSSRWHLLTVMQNHFWKRWQREFLAQAQQRAKWLHPNHSFKIGDIVLFRDEFSPPTKWPLGRIVRLFPGNDGLTRVARIKTAPWNTTVR